MSHNSVVFMKDVLVKEAPVEEAVLVNATIPEFEPYTKDYFEQRYKDKDKLVLVAYIDENAAGYIIAYDRFQDGSLYCWMAGVNPRFRRKGILRALMDYQDTWAKGKGYDKIRIKTRNNRRQMLAYLVKTGFFFTEVIQYPDIKDNRILLKKTFSHS